MPLGVSSMIPRTPGSLLALVTILLASSTSAQQLLIFGSNALPACAQQCQLLLQAQSGCVPPGAPTGTSLSYETCFCQSGYLTTLKTDPAAICGTVCSSSSDLAQISTWYTNNCADGGVAAAAALTSVTSTMTSTAAGGQVTTSTLTSVATAGSTSAATGSGDSSSTATAAQTGSWWSNHWKWVMMVIIIFGVLALLTVIGILVRKRHLRNRDKITTSFNAGITTRTAPTPPPMATRPDSTAVTYSAEPYGHYPTAGEEGRATPNSMTNPYGQNASYGHTPAPGAGALSRVRERDRDSTTLGYQVRGGTPVSEMEQGNVLKKNKGKGRAEPVGGDVSPL